MIAAGAVARGDSLSLRLEPSLSVTETRTRDAAGAIQTGETTGYAGNYQLSLQKGLYESIGLSATGTFQDSIGRARIGEISTHEETSAWSADTRLGFGQELLRGALGYSRNDSSSSSRSSADVFALVRPVTVTETWSGALSWTPIDLPSLEGRIAQDTAETLGVDRSSLTAGLTSNYRPAEQVSLSAALGYSTSEDRISGVESATLGQTASASVRESFWRSTVFAQGSIANTSTSTRAGEAGGVVRTQRFPNEGLSLVEGLSDSPERETLQTNPLVIDGDVAATTGLNIGFGPTLGGDQAARTAGVRFVELQPVNLVQAWIDEPLPVTVSSAYLWDVYRSDNNLDWVRVVLAGPVLFDPVENRFDIPIVSTLSPYLKVVTRPISPAVSPEPRFRDIAITELRVYLVQAAAELPRRASAVSATLGGAIGTRLLSVPSLRHDLAASLASSNWETPTWQVSNALTLSHRLRPTVGVGANLVRSDNQSERGHSGQTSYGASITATPIPTFTSGASFSGQVSEADGISYSNGVAGFARAALYRGVDVSTNLSYVLAVSPDDRSTGSFSASTSASLVPLRWLTVTGAAVTARARSTGAGAPSTVSDNSQLSASVGVNPFPALYASAGVSRAVGSGIRPTTLFSFSGTYSPLREGALLLSFGHSQTFETSTQARNQLTSGSIRWNFVPSAFVEGGYSLIESEALQLSTRSQSIGGRLAVSW